MSGVLLAGSNSIPFNFAGTITDTIAEGHNPSISFSVKSDDCPNHSSAFTGIYNHRMFVEGPVELFDQDCNVTLTYQMALALTAGAQG